VAVVFDSSTDDTDEMVSFLFPEFTLGMLRFSCLEEWFSEELIKFVQLLIPWLMRGSQVDSCVSTSQIRAMSRGCFTSYMLVWDLGDFTTYRSVLEMFAWRDFAEDVLVDFPDDAWAIAVGWGRWSINAFPFDTWRLGIVDALSFCDHIEFSWMSDFRVGLVDSTEIHWKDMILNSGDDPLRHYNLWLQE